jgi:hypothetical protein
VRFKHLPDPPAALDAVADGQRTVPLVPAPEDETVARLERRLDLPSRDVGRRWLTLLRALGLVERTSSGFRRRSVEPTPAHLRTAFPDRVHLARETLAALSATEPRTAAEVFASVRADVPAWERHKNPETWAADWRDRTGRLLGWLALLGLAEATAAGYLRAADAGGGLDGEGGGGLDGEDG